MKQAAGGMEEDRELDWLSTDQNLRMDDKILVKIVRLHCGYEENI
jgi:hypothetical protein